MFAFAILLPTIMAVDASKPLTPAVNNFLGDQAIAILRGPSRIEGFLIESVRMAEGKEDPTKPALDGYPVIATAAELNKRFAARLAEVFFDAKTYSFDSAKGCIFSPGVAFRIWKDAECVEVVLCYSCSEFHLIVKDAAGQVVRKTGEDFDGSRVMLVKLAKEAFPSDPKIQALK